MALAITLKTSGTSGAFVPYGTGSVTSASFTLADGSLLAVFLGAIDDGAGDIASALTITDSAGLTWTRRVYAGRGGGWAAQIAVWTAPVVTGTAMTITFDCGAHAVYDYMWFVEQVTGHDTTTPTGGTASNSSATNDGALSVALSVAPATDDMVLAAVFLDGDSSGTVAVTPGSTYTEIGEVGGTTNGGYGELERRTGSTSTTVDWVDIRAGTMTTYSNACAGIVIKVGTGGGPTSTPMTFTGAVAPDGALVDSISKTLTGTITPDGALINGVAKSLSGAMTGVGTLLQATLKGFGGSVTPDGAIANLKAVLRTFTGAIIPTGVVSQETRKTLTGNITPDGGLLRSLQKTLTGAIAPTGTLDNLKAVLRTFVGEMTPAGTLGRSTGKALTGVLTPLGTLTQGLSRLFTGAAIPAGTLTRSTEKALAGSVAPAGSWLRSIGKALTGEVTPNGLVVQTVWKTFVGIVGLIGDLINSLAAPVLGQGELVVHLSEEHKTHSSAAISIRNSESRRTWQSR